MHSPKVLEALVLPVTQAVVDGLDADEPLPSRRPAFMGAHSSAMSMLTALVTVILTETPVRSSV